MENELQYDDELDLGPSKSQLKREASALQDLGERLIALNGSQLTEVPMSDQLAEAVRLAQRIKAHGARRRQLQYIGKLMRDEDAGSIRKALEHLDPASPRAMRVQHLCEQWRERLIEQGNEGVTAFVAEYPQTDVQALRQKLRLVNKEREKGAPPKYYRELYRDIRSVIESA